MADTHVLPVNQGAQAALLKTCVNLRTKYIDKLDKFQAKKMRLNYFKSHSKGG